MKYLAVLGRQSEISVAELEALFCDVRVIQGGKLAKFDSENEPDIDRLGGSLKIAKRLDEKPLGLLMSLPDGKITIGVSDYSKGASRKTAVMEGLKLKKILVRHGRSVRIVESKDAVLTTATSLHNGLSGRKERKVELIKVDDEWYRVIGVQDIDAYTKRDQARPARDAFVGMLPPKLAQILINLCGLLGPGATVLDPFCGTGVVLQEALLMGYRAYGTDISERMVEYANRNLNWLFSEHCDQRGALTSEPCNDRRRSRADETLAFRIEATPDGRPLVDRRERGSEEKSQYQVSVGDATSFRWAQAIDAVACEGYLGRPMSQAPAEIKLKAEKQECGAIILGFLKNLAGQIKLGTPVVVAIPAWLRPDGSYSRIDILDEIEGMGYNVSNKTREGLLYHRKEQVVARDIIILRKN